MTTSIPITRVRKRAQSLHKTIKKGEVVDFVHGANKATVCHAFPVTQDTGDMQVGVPASDFWNWPQSFLALASVGKAIRVTGGSVDFVVSAPASGSPIPALKAVADHSASAHVTPESNEPANREVDDGEVLKALTRLVAVELGKATGRRSPGRPRKQQAA